MESLPQSAMLTQEVLLHRIANRIRQSLELREILAATVAEVRSYLGTDRVKVYQFAPDGHGVVIAESIQAGRLPSLLGLNFPADDIPLYARELFVRSRQRSIVNLEAAEIGLSPMELEETGEPLRSQPIRYRPVDPCHVEYLTAMGVKSSVVVPIVLANSETGTHKPPALDVNAQLWGLLVSHHSESRQVTDQELQFIQSVVDQMAIAISQSILLQRVRDQAQQEAHINHVTALLYTTPTVQLQAALEAAVEAFAGSGGRLYLLANEPTQAIELYTCGDQPQHLDQATKRPIEENLLWQNYLKSALPSHSAEAVRPWSVEWMRSVYALTPVLDATDPDLSLWAISDIYKEPLLRVMAPFFQDSKIRGMLILPLTYGTEVVGCLTVFRDEVNTEILWAGAHDPDTRQMMARQSFEVWRQLKSGQAQQWTEAELKLAKAFGERFSMAVKQYRLYQQVQGLNSNLEHQVEERTAQLQQSNLELQRSTLELQQSVDHQQALARIIAKIRASLELDAIFKAAATEVQELLSADRVVIYRFDPEAGDGSGEVVSEAVLSEFPSILNAKLSECCMGKSRLIAYAKGNVRAIDDLHQAGLTECHVQMLAQFQVKADLIVPLLVGDRLWGLLCVHQCTTTRHWQQREIEFTQQVAAQIGVALQHAVLLGRTRQQAKQLSEAIEHLQRTQTHLIQSEKMSSLGQLVAGVAHEINNPVSFIYGNLSHVSSYTRSLLKLIELYQQHYPEPNAEIQHYAEEADLEFVASDLPHLLASLEVGADRIREIVLSLRNFSRLDQARMKPVDIHEGLDNTLMILQHRIKADSSHTEIAIVKQYSNLPLVECSAGQLNQVFMNLLSNAIDSLRDTQDQQREAGLPQMQGKITVRTEAIDPDHAQIVIQDNGNGIPASIQHRLFDPFFTTKPVGKGTGLGLSISYQIVEQHGGKLECISHPGQGAAFVIRLPIEQRKSEAIQQGTIQPSGDPAVA
ncbi:GAF domain-containing protein [Microcoleus sp. FACHB-1515]|uniref:GAF domain-containing sensor histidine kinase n=1 Tax=Cyanophyceae TaxID=3028117 RepID=UPI001689F8D3|nr:GAF domain-containing protein [Microcoleus sp. FACHB-1515]MBD2092749.1 GAF domain-containing protein [Microcoleus sp. FACHB-1515]